MKQRWTTAAVLLLLLCILAWPGMAQEETGFGGTKEWITVRGMQWTMSRDAVILIEERRDAGFAPVTQREGYEIWTAGAQVLGKEATWVYHFAQGVLAQADLQFSFPLDQTQAADEMIAALRQELSALYGEPYADEGKASVTEDDAQGYVEACRWGDGWTTFEQGASFLDSDLTLMFDMRQNDILVTVSASGGVYTY